ncbi:hypothetical protein B0H17DRAFT_1135335 [Mycena rosella]|uniref:Uncharacterized protein n=1 Tax=Mycena rosella TaxID=1033263 RepID=A0AAD7GHC7_MYCRO|nr:hypothetical protein B0H17DRAFT_1135335 [Mycena rosella]
MSVPPSDSISCPSYDVFSQSSEDWENGPPSLNWIHGGWYTDPTLPEQWSTDWDNWAGLRLFDQTVDGKLKIDKLFKDTFDVPGTVEPLAYDVVEGDEFFLFTAGGRYYYWADGGTLTVHREEFASPKDFMDYLFHENGDIPDVEIPMYPGANLDCKFANKVGLENQQLLMPPCRPRPQALLGRRLSHLVEELELFVFWILPVESRCRRPAQEAHEARLLTVRPLWRSVKLMAIPNGARRDGQTRLCFYSRSRLILAIPTMPQNGACMKAGDEQFESGGGQEKKKGRKRAYEGRVASKNAQGLWAATNNTGHVKDGGCVTKGRGAEGGWTWRTREQGQ